MAKHCWHSTGITLYSNPPQYPHVCCNCGEGWTQMARVEYVAGHGPHVPQQSKEVWETPPDDECEPRPVPAPRPIQEGYKIWSYDRVDNIYKEIGRVDD